MTTIKLADLKSEKIPHSKIGVENVLERRNVWCTSSKSKLVYKSSAGFASSALLAYSYHRKFVIRPDDIWLVISQGASAYILENAELYRDTFVPHQGKEEICVYLDHVAHHGTSSKLMWGPGVDLICAEIKKRTNCDVEDVFANKFSSTTPESSVASKITLMKAMEKYFSYRMCTLCGIPEVEMLGTLEDWKLLEQKIQKLESMLVTVKESKKCSRWLQNIKLIASNLTKTFENADNITEDLKRWWSHIFDIKTTHGSGAGTYYSGWIRNLYLYTSRGEYMPTNDRKIDWEDFPFGLCEVDFVFDHNGNQTNLQLVSGHAGTHERDDGALVPNIAWFVVEPKTKTIKL